MKSLYRFFLILSLAVFVIGNADTTVWRGQVNSDGSPTSSVKLTIGKTYKIKVKGTMNLGKWRTNKQPLEEDACFEFFANADYQKTPPTKIDAFKNSINLSVCDGTYKPDHHYESKPFVAVQSGVHFWIQDTDYEDNHGGLEAEVIEVKKKI